MNKELEQYVENLPGELILMGYCGSIAHGTFRPNSHPNSVDDFDVMGICFGANRDYFGFGSVESDKQGTFGRVVFEQSIFKEGVWDVITYEVRKFFRLLVKNNPNVMGLLWLDDYLFESKAGRELISFRDLFSSKQAYYSFGGYAHSQLTKMENLAFEGYMGEKRRELVRKFGYDTKNASHCIRLLKQGIEFLETGKMVVRRPDAEELLAIKDGKYSLHEIKGMAYDLKDKLTDAYEKSPLPEQPNIVLIEEFLIDLFS